MAEFTIPKHGEICWRELSSVNVEKAKPFYEQLLGWRLRQSQVTTMPYDEIHLGDKAIGGMMKIDENWGDGWQNIPAHWMTYIAVDDCDAAAQKIAENGGSIRVEPFDAPGVGRMAVAGDPGGATFSVIQFVENSSGD